MYDKNYVQTWIDNHESWKDSFRIDYLDPYLKEIFKDINNMKVLDVWCGWGVLLDFLKSNNSYCGIDVAVDFFDYIREKKSEIEIILKYGKLPSNIDVLDSFFDICVCSQVLHTVSNLENSIDTLFSKLKSNGKLIIIVFNEKSKEPLIDSFDPIEEVNDVHVIGETELPSGFKVHAEVYFHKEKDYEKQLLNHGSFKKKELGPLFVAYECIKE